MEPEYDLTPLVLAGVLLLPFVAGWLMDATKCARRARRGRR